MKKRILDRTWNESGNRVRTDVEADDQRRLKLMLEQIMDRRTDQFKRKFWTVLWDETNYGIDFGTDSVTNYGTAHGTNAGRMRGISRGPGRERHSEYMMDFDGLILEQNERLDSKAGLELNYEWKNERPRIGDGFVSFGILRASSSSQQVLAMRW